MNQPSSSSFRFEVEPPAVRLRVCVSCVSACTQQAHIPVWILRLLWLFSSSELPLWAHTGKYVSIIHQPARWNFIRFVCSCKHLNELCTEIWGRHCWWCSHPEPLLWLFRITHPELLILWVGGVLNHFSLIRQQCKSFNQSVPFLFPVWSV